MNVTHFAKLLFALLAFIFSVSPLDASAADNSNHQIVDGLAIYVAIFPAELILGHPKQHQEGEMHGGVPAGPHNYHLTVALFDANTGKRISGVRVKAKVSEIGLTATEKKLDPMAIAGTISYGNYFRIPGNGTYRIQVQIYRPGFAHPVTAGFDYQHARA